MIRDQSCWWGSIWGGAFRTILDPSVAPFSLFNSFISLDLDQYSMSHVNIIQTHTIRHIYLIYGGKAMESISYGLLWQLYEQRALLSFRTHSCLTKSKDNEMEVALQSNTQMSCALGFFMLLTTFYRGRFWFSVRCSAVVSTFKPQHHLRSKCLTSTEQLPTVIEIGLEILATEVFIVINLIISLKKNVYIVKLSIHHS